MSNFTSLHNAQNINAIIHIFAKKPITELQSPTPYCIVLVGAPGVGKTTQASKYLREMGLEYDNFYHVSLDSLVEKVKPYRNTTFRVYKQLTSNNIGLLNSIYLQTIKSHNKNFSLKATKNSRIKQIKTKQSGGTKRKRSIKRSIKQNTPLKSLMELREEGFKHGVMNHVNIIYDTTLSISKDKIRTDIMPIIEMSPVKYKIIVILVTADEDIIKNRIEKRQRNMISKQYIRSVNPKAITKLISQNEEAFEKSKKYFKSNNMGIYTPDDFEFIKIDNSANVNNLK